MKMKKILLNTAFIIAAAVLGGCDSFFEIDTNDTLNDSDYISEESEMYSGYIGIMTKMQAIGDKVIYLNELRGEIVEPTSTAPTELFNLYNYDDDLSGNSYADPSGFYEVINACNDYLRKLKTYKENSSINESHYKSLVSSTLRIKAWTFMTIAKIYGKAVWVDKPMNSLRDLSKFKTLELEDVMIGCKNMLDIGYDDVDGTYETSWKDWVDPDTELANSEYRRWDMMTPPYYALYGEICLWLGKYQKCIDVIQGHMNSVYEKTNNQSIAFLRNDMLLGKWSSFWNNETPYDYESVSAIMYAYQNRQTNALLKHFDSEYPNKYWLAPAEAGIARFTDTDFGPLGNKTEDFRMGNTVKKYNGKWVISKFRPISGAVRAAYRNDVFIYIYRGADLYFMLAEAFNQLGKRNAIDALINSGIESYTDEFEKDADNVLSGTWYGFTPHWTTQKTVYNFANGTSSISSRKYGDKGIRATSYNNMGARLFTNDTRENDEEILKEMMLEMSCEGKVYPTMIRMARRHKDNSIIAKYIAEKYESTGNASTIRSKIMSGDYFIKWDLGTE